jgi:peptidyl-prolyl cis-trans isomerase C
MRWPSKSSADKFATFVFSTPLRNIMKFPKSALAAAALIVAAPWAAAQNVAIVNGKAVPTARVEMLAKQAAASGRQLDDATRAQLKEEVILREIFMQEALKRGIPATEDYKIQMELARQTIMIRAMFQDYQAKNPVTDAEVKAEYDKFVASNGGKEYRARHILVEKEDEAKAIIASLKGGAKFEDIAKKQSKDPGSGANGGDLDWANASSYVTEFSEAMIKLDKGQMTQEPVKSQFGWHIIRVDDIRQAQLPKLEEIKDQIAQQMQQQKMAAFQNSLREKAKVE